MKRRFVNDSGTKVIILDSEKSWRYNRRELVKMVREWPSDEYFIDYLKLFQYLGSHTRTVVRELNSICDSLCECRIHVKTLTPVRSHRGGRPTADTFNDQRTRRRRRPRLVSVKGGMII